MAGSDDLQQIPSHILSHDVYIPHRSRSGRGNQWSVVMTNANDKLEWFDPDSMTAYMVGGSAAPIAGFVRFAREGEEPDGIEEATHVYVGPCGDGAYYLYDLEGFVKGEAN